LLASISVGADGAVWGLNASSLIYRFIPSINAFYQAPGFLTNISVGADDMVWGIN
jgi:hypothetical protein